MAVTRAHPGQLADFITEQVSAPRGAWILGCVLQFADAEYGARFWRQYAAGAGARAGDDAASCLYLHHLARGDSHAAAFWREQTGIDTPQETNATSPADDDAAADSLSVDTSIPTVLRILSRLTPAAGRGHSEATVAVMEYVAAAVAAGYAYRPDYEIPPLGPHFAEQIEIILAAASPGSSRRRRPSSTALPNRPHTDDRLNESRAQEPERVLVEVAAMDDESASAFKEAIAACWEAATADLTAREMDTPGVRLRYYLDRRPIIDTLRASRTGASQRS
ncbi:DUF6207 family protein [Streptomyces scopuliridis]|uniref:DUF6207 family protein n=1 Tax=Streptomyces scopuliridis TaxID=452529 RepID=UPI0036782A22